MERLRRFLIPSAMLREQRFCTREYRRWEQGWKRNALLNGKPLTSSAIRRIGSRARATELGLIKA